MGRYLKIILLLQALIGTFAPILADCEGKVFNLSESATKAAEAKALVRQNDRNKLDETQCGGTCATMAVANAVLITANAIREGQIVELARRAKPELNIIQRQVVEDILSEYRAKTNRSGLDGAIITDFSDIFPKVYAQNFGEPLYPIHLSPTAYNSFQSIDTNENALLVLSVQFGKQNHAILTHSIRPAGPADKLLFGEAIFVATVSDPLLPYIKRNLGIYLHNGLFYLMNYLPRDAANAPAVRGQGLTAFAAGLINHALVVSINSNADLNKTWNATQAKQFASNRQNQRRVRITTKTGYSFTRVKIPANQFPFIRLWPAKNLRFTQRFTTHEANIPYKDIADIQFE